MAPSGPLSTQIARLAVFWQALEHDVAIITTNYDSAFEEFAGDDELRKYARRNRVSMKSYVLDDVVSNHIVPIYHLHGYVPQVGQPRGDLAFSEVGLALGTEVLKRTPSLRGDWRSRVIRRRLRTSTTLFIGTTLRDPTVVDALANTPPEPWGRYAIFPRQGDSWLAEPTPTRELAEEAFETRLRHLGVTAVRPDFFSQTPQLLNEIVHCRTNGDGRYAGNKLALRRYGQRLEDWWREWQALQPKGHASVVDVQDNCQRALEAARREFIEVVKPRRSELIKLEVWVRRRPHDYRELMLWGSSETAYRNEKSAHRALIENQSNYAAVRAFCLGFVFSDSLPEESTSRWRSYLSVPIVLMAKPWHRLPLLE